LHGLLLNMRRVVSRIYGALFRGSLVQGGFLPVPRKIARTVQIIVSIGFETVDDDEGRKAVRRVREVLRVKGVEQTPEGYVYKLLSAE
ncbi:hypothetical protein ABQ144_20220, partial [Xanthomonas hortorum pv. hederae]